jgi:integrase/recombinase XerC
MVAEHGRFIGEYLAHIRPRAASTTFHRKQWQIRSFFTHMAAKEKTPANITRADVEAYLAGQTCTQQYRQALCVVVREFYEVMRQRHPDECPHENPAAGIEFKPDKSTRLPKVPSQAAIDALFARLYENDGDLHIRDRLMAELAYGSGLRRSELTRLNIEDVDLATNTAHVLGKGNKPRVVPLTGQTVDTMREYLRRRHATRGPLLLSFMGRRLGNSGVYDIMRHRVGMRPHLFRHACATHMLRNGCGIRVIQELLGHERLETTHIYTTVEKENLRQVVGRNHPRAMAKKP